MLFVDGLGMLLWLLFVSMVTGCCLLAIVTAVNAADNKQREIVSNQ